MVQFVPTPRLTIFGMRADSSITPNSAVGAGKDPDDARRGLVEQLAESSATKTTTVVIASSCGVEFFIWRETPSYVRSCRLTTQAQRRRPRGAAIATVMRCRRSLQRIS